MAPARQDFISQGLARFEIDQGLEMRLDLFIANGDAQIVLERGALMHALIHARFKEGKAPASVILGAIERNIGAAHQGFAVAPIHRRNSDAQSGAHRDFMAAQRKRRFEATNQRRKPGHQLVFALIAASAKTNSSPPSRATNPSAPASGAAVSAILISNSSPTACP